MKKLSISSLADKVGQDVILYGWAYRIRNHKKVVFIDLRDVSGDVQIVGGPELASINPEDVVCIKGLVKERPAVLRQIACFQTGCCGGAFGKKINQEHLSSKPRKLTVRAHPSFTHAQNSTLRQGSCGLSTFSAEILILQSSQESGPA